MRAFHDVIVSKFHHYQHDIIVILKLNHDVIGHFVFFVLWSFMVSLCAYAVLVGNSLRGSSDLF